MGLLGAYIQKVGGVMYLVRDIHPVVSGVGVVALCHGEVVFNGSRVLQYEIQSGLRAGVDVPVVGWY